MIKTTNVTKSFGDHLAVKNLSLSVSRGSIVGFLGPNGAGKSTTMRILTGYFQADSGQVNICGFDIAKDMRSAQACIGYLPEAVSGFSHLTAREFLSFCCSARGFGRLLVRESINRLIKTVELRSVIDKQLRILSKGWRQRIWLAQAIIHDPPVLILDEPTDGLDPNQKDTMRDLIKFIGFNKSIILSTHILEEAEELCDRVVIISNGKKIVDKPKLDLVDENGKLTKAFRELTQ